MGKQYTVDGQLGDKAVVEVGKGSLYVGGKNEAGEYVSAAMLSPRAGQEVRSRDLQRRRPPRRGVC